MLPALGQNWVIRVRKSVYVRYGHDFVVVVDFSEIQLGRRDASVLWRDIVYVLIRVVIEVARLMEGADKSSRSAELLPSSVMSHGSCQIRTGRGGARFMIMSSGRVHRVVQSRMWMRMRMRMVGPTWRCV